MSHRPIRLVVFDLAGTIADCGCFGPIRAFQGAFEAHGVSLSVEEARGPMGLAKRDHLRVLLETAAIGRRWRETTGRDADEAAVDELYAVFIEQQLASIAEFSEPIAGLGELVAWLANRGIACATTTGYFRAAAEPVWAALRSSGFRSAADLCPDDVPEARPAPWMVFRAMEATGVYPPSAVVKIGDTPHDIAEGLNAGAYSLGVTRTGSRVGCLPAEWAALSAEEQQARTAAATSELRDAGAHAVLDSVLDLPAWIEGSLP